MDKANIARQLGYEGDITGIQSDHVNRVAAYMKRKQVVSVKAAAAALARESSGSGQANVGNFGLTDGVAQVAAATQSTQDASERGLETAFASGFMQRAMEVAEQNNGAALFDQHYSTYVQTGALPEDPQMAAAITNVAQLRTSSVVPVRPTGQRRLNLATLASSKGNRMIGGATDA